ncbi:hypothetical protein BSKO_04352 [Bryopsis sp. KO-2023]|nr:hypothetical protein BSKO_04352 [Bryopsis sp. KO-2023]
MSNVSGWTRGAHFLPKARAPAAGRRLSPIRPCATAEISQRPAESKASVAPAPKHSEPAPFIHEIPSSRWESGIPPVMGAHLMDSGAVAPISMSKGAGMDVARHVFQYPDGEYECGVMLYGSAPVAAEGVSQMVLAAAEKSIAAKGTFTLVLSGGSLVNALGALAGQKTAWEKWHVFWVDERVVPHSHPDSNLKGAREAFLGNVPIPEENVHGIVEGLTATEAAKNYEGMLLGLGADVLPKAESGFPIFDMILLGIGPDGHVASLFPNRPQTAAVEGWVLPIDDSPKPPPSRITLTMPVINHAAEVAVVALGEGKSEIIARCLEHQALPGALPAQMVRPISGTLTWVLDSGSSKDLSVGDWETKKAFPASSFS